MCDFDSVKSESSDGARADQMCSSCEVAAWKYRCPGCLTLSCSVACVVAHKQKTGCTGKRNPVVEVPMKEMDEALLQNDYRSLANNSA